MAQKTYRSILQIPDYQYYTKMGFKKIYRVCNSLIIKYIDLTR